MVHHDEPPAAIQDLSDAPSLPDSDIVKEQQQSTSIKALDDAPSNLSITAPAVTAEPTCTSPVISPSSGVAADDNSCEEETVTPNETKVTPSLDLNASAPLTQESLEQQQHRIMQHEQQSSSIRAWAANLPEVPDNVQPITTGPSHIFELQPSTDDDTNEPRIQETKDIFTETQKVAYVGLCALTSLEVVHDHKGKEFTYARMSADNWQRKLMRTIYMHMGISSEEIKMIESLSKHNILPSDLVHQFTAQGETTTINMDGFQEVKQEQHHHQPRHSSSSTSKFSSTESSALTVDSKGSLDARRSEHNARSSSSSSSTCNSDQQANASDDKKSGQFVIDLRWTVMTDLLLLFLGSETFDARSRVFIARVASYLELDWIQVIGFEKRITDHLITNASLAWETETATSIATTMTTTTDMDISVRNDSEKASRNKQRRKRRYVMIGLATIGGGLILGLSAGLMAPIIAGGLGTILSTVGVTGAGSFLGGSTGIALITGAATGIGSGMGAKGMKRRMKTINTFEFSPVSLDERVNCIISISGWLPKKAHRDLAALPFSVLDPMMGDHYTLYWEPEMLEDLGSAFKIFATEVVTFSIQQALAHTIMGALLAGLAWPLALTKLGYLVDNPWNNGLDRARLAGLILADSIMNRNLGARPVTLIGYSLGARVIFYCLLELARVNAYGLVENVALFGTPVNASKAQWKECTSVVAGRFVNGYATNDWLLGFLFRASTAGLGNVAGLRPLRDIEGDHVHNIDCSDLIKGHLSYRKAMPMLLKRAGFVVTSEELPGDTKGEEEEEEFELDLSGAKDLENFRPATMTRGSSVSSLKSGKASIQYPPPKTKCNPHQQENSNDATSDVASTIAAPPPPDVPSTTAIITNTAAASLSESVQPKSSTDTQQPPSSQHPRISTSSPEPMNEINHDETNNSNHVIPNDDEIIAEIIAKATAVSKASGQYSSLSSGRASIAKARSSDSSPPPIMTQSLSESSSRPASIRSIDNHRSSTSHPRNSMSSSIFSKLVTGGSNKKKPIKDDEKARQELAEAGIEVKEIKSTLGRMVVPDDVVNPMPKITLEKPQYARVNR
ncbi:hypothetical protein LRAMOSA09226 [Lichtheimia ramosa]|uniref:DUF726 domain protein n=1 Tax=Lichtheimia ramosa TaxID=688394 RepID=A0A077WHP6_9FUNG|nr:hypothetical protein LRAMOSA09226 [Lichtheimia ramosa]